MISSTKIFIAIFVYFCFAVGSIVHGQYRFDAWTTDNGLPQNGLRQITQTPDGYLWFTTFDGLVRFDGVQFTTFNKSNTKGIINNRFTGLFGDADGTLYATTMEDGILTIFRDGTFSSLTSDQVPGHYINRVERDSTGELRFLVEDEERTSKSWYRLTGEKFEFIEKQPAAATEIIFHGSSGVQWTITTAGITEMKGGRAKFIPLDLARVPQTTNLFEDRDGGLWIGENRIHRLRDGALRTFGESDGLPSTSAYHKFWQEADGSVWSTSGGIGMPSPGLVQIQGEKLLVWGRDHGLLSTTIHDVFTDREGTAWLATDRGLGRRRKQVIQGYSTNDGIDHSEIYPIYRDREDNIWIGSTKGLTIYRDGKFEALEFKPLSPSTPVAETWRTGHMSVQSLWEDANGKMWAGLNGGIFVIQNGVAEMLFKGSHVFAIKNDRQGNVWAATNKGLLRFNDYKLTAQFTTKEGLPNEFMTFIFEDSKGSLWFGGYGGLSKFENGTFTNYTTNEGLVGNYVRTIYEDSDGAFWIGTYDEGMSRFKDGKFVNYRESDGLYNSGVFAIEEDAAGFFWISSNRGIYRVNRRDLNAFADGVISKINSVGYGKEDGMLSTECNGGRQPASLRTKDGKFWFPTQDGVAVIDPLAEQSNPLPPSVVIETLVAEREAVEFRDGAVIEPGKKDLEIRYTGISLIKSEQIRFKYKLDGHDADWIDAGTRRTAYYSYLPPGNYTFYVKAANSDGVWNEQGSAVKIELKPYFYQTTTFLLISIFGSAMLLLAIWKVSVHQLEANERRLSRLVKERTAELAEANENLVNLANSDGLTKIGNRRRFESFLTDEWHRAVRFKTEISLILIDIDHFKRYNDTYGHQAGDECLQRVAEAFAETIKRPTDLVARFGGEEFALVLGGTDAAGALTIAEQAVANVKALQIEHDKSLTSEFLTVSVGIATMFAKFDNAETDLIKAADEALYNAKANGRDRIYAYDHFTQLSINADVLSHEHFDVKPN
jgi:diguanylate cyclase (GGDEF)-like protein